MCYEQDTTTPTRRQIASKVLEYADLVAQSRNRLRAGPNIYEEEIFDLLIVALKFEARKLHLALDEMLPAKSPENAD
jgi:hypothetical protein